MPMKADNVLSCAGQSIPSIQTMLENAMTGTKTKDGEVLLVLASDLQAAEYVVTWMEAHGHQLLAREEGGPFASIYVRVVKGN
jgi:TusA-related sulfurtransferase